MATYVVTSDNFALPQGSEVTGDQLAGCDVAALVEGGHLVPVDSPKEQALNPDPAKAGRNKEN